MSLRRRSAYISGKLTAWFREYPRDGYGKPFQYKDSMGSVRDAVAGPSFDYLFIHQLHHRGQISQILDEVGLPNNFADNLLFLEGAYFGRAQRILAATAEGEESLVSQKLHRESFRVHKTVPPYLHGVRNPPDSA